MKLQEVNRLPMRIWNQEIIDNLESQAHVNRLPMRIWNLGTLKVVSNTKELIDYLWGFETGKIKNVIEIEQS